MSSPDTTSSDLVFAASRIGKKGQRLVEELDERAAAGISSGSAASRNPKFWPNEDSVAVHRLPDGSYLAAVADSHWGGLAGEEVVHHLKAAYEQAQAGAKSPLIHLRLTMRGIDARLHARRKRDDRSETTALLVRLQGRKLHYVNVGDSLLYILGQGRAWLQTEGLAPESPFPVPFLGVVPLATVHRDILPPSGTVELEPGQRVLLATDGLETPFSGLRPEELPGLFPPASRLADCVTRLLAAADDPTRRGGADNLGVVALGVE